MNPTFLAAWKTLVVIAAGSVAPLVLGAFDHPTGGTAVALATNPLYASLWGAASYFAHNLYDHYLGTASGPPATASTSSSSKAA